MDKGEEGCRGPTRKPIYVCMCIDVCFIHTELYEQAVYKENEDNSGFDVVSADANELVTLHISIH